MTRPYVGHAVRDSQIYFSSPSAMREFDPDSEGGCYRKYPWKYKYGKKSPQTPAQRNGQEKAKELETYLKTGALTLSPQTMAGQHLLPKPGRDLEVEEPLGDIAAAVKLRERFLRGENVSEDAIWDVAGLVAAGIPLMGAADCRHFRGEYVDANGVLRREDPGMVVCEIIDHKTTARIDDHVTKAGTIYRGYAKAVDELSSDLQLLSYGAHAARRHRDLTHVRFSLVYYQMKNGLAAAKRTTLVPVDEIWGKWERVDDLARRMEQVVRTERIEDVEPNLKSCTSYGGCPHADYCPRNSDQVIVSLFGNGERKESGGANMSLFSRALKPDATLTTAATTTTATTTAVPAVPVTQSSATTTATTTASTPSTQTTTATPAQTTARPSLFGRLGAQKPAGANGTNGNGSNGTAVPTVDAAQRAAEIAAEKERLRAEDAAHAAAQAAKAAVSALGPRIDVADCEMDVEYLVVAGAAPPAPMTFAGTSKGFSFFADAAGQRQRFAVADIAVHANNAPAPEISAVLPPDATKPDFVTSAAVLPAEEVAKIVDPEIKARVEAHARAAAELAALSAKTSEEKAGGRCAAGGQRVPLTVDMAMAREMVCATCGKTIKLKPAKDGERWIATLPNHNRPKLGEDAKPEMATETTPEHQAHVAVAEATIQTAPESTATSTATSTVTSGATASTETAIPAEATSTASAATVQAPQTTTATTTASGEIKGLAIYVDVAFVRGGMTLLENYYRPLLDELAAQAGAIDILCPPEESFLADGRWRGALKSLVAENLPEPGEYLAFSSNEVERIVLDALRPRCERYAQAVK